MQAHSVPAPARRRARSRVNRRGAGCDAAGIIPGMGGAAAALARAGGARMRPSRGKNVAMHATPSTSAGLPLGDDWGGCESVSDCEAATRTMILAGLLLGSATC